MTINTFEGLREWFYGNSRKGAAAPYWTLFGSAWGNKESIITRNDHKDNIDEAYKWLEDTIRRVNNPAGQRFRVMQVDIPAGNNPVGQVHVQIYQEQTQQVAGIQGSPSGYVGEAKVQEMISAAREKWEMENEISSLRAALESPADMWEKILDGFNKISATPVGMAIVTKLTGVPIQPQPQIQEEPLEPSDEAFYDDMQEAARTIGTTEYELARKLRDFVKSNPEIAKQMMSQ